MVKDATREKLLELRETYGTATAIEVAKKSLKINSSDVSFKQQFNGEVCETVLEMILQKIIKEEHPDWFYSKSMILPNPDSNNEFLTELDFVLFTPNCVYCIECKSYAGKKIITDKGTVELNKYSRDVYKQNIMHLEMLSKLIGNFSESPVYRMVLFNFSRGDIVDKRDEKWKGIFPVVDENTFPFVFKQEGKAVWDMQGLRAARVKLERFSEQNRERHLAYVQSLHGKK